MPEFTYSPDIKVLFSNLAYNWNTISPILWVLYGILFVFGILALAKKILK